MKKLLDAIYGLALILIFGTALLADGLADMPGGFVIMVAAITAAGVLVSVGNRLEASLRRQSRKTTSRKHLLFISFYHLFIVFTSQINKVRRKTK